MEGIFYTLLVSSSLIITLIVINYRVAEFAFNRLFSLESRKILGKFRGSTFLVILGTKRIRLPSSRISRSMLLAEKLCVEILGGGHNNMYKAICKSNWLGQMCYYSSYPVSDEDIPFSIRGIVYCYVAARYRNETVIQKLISMKRPGGSTAHVNSV